MVCGEMVMELTELASVVTGPAAATIICLIVMWKGYKLIVEQIIPAQHKIIQDILEEHRKDRNVFIDSIALMDKRLASVEDDMSEIKYILKEK
jgi:hypothetical protein